MADGADPVDPVDRGPIDRLLDFFVFAPLGLLVESHSIVPRLAETGRQEVESRIQLARMVGQFAVQQGRRQAARVVDNLRATGAAPPAARAERPTQESTSATDPTSGAPEPFDDDDDEIDAEARSAAAGDAAGDDRGIAEEDLAIPSYDSLAASQVVPRLHGLTSIELEAVRRYELAHRGRRTVLGKIALLQSPA